jgi:RimJ/RimL family protein N-acetyltransferase
MPSFPSPDGSITDGVVALRLSAERDIPEVLIAYQDDRDLASALGERRPPSGAALGSRAECAPEMMAAGQAIVFSIVEPDGDVCRGEVRVDQVDWGQGTAVLTVWVARELRGHGLGPRAAGLAGGWLSTQCGLEATCSRAE